MSSLAAVQADGYYYPPDFDAAKHGSLNAYHNSHGALGDRARKLDQGILIIRFEVPFHIWCSKCGEKIATGERFNAEKRGIGFYHTTRIWQFAMRHHCGCIITIQTDPKNAAYIVVEGAKKKNEEHTAADLEVMELVDTVEREQLEKDPLYRLEQGEASRKRARTAAEHVLDLLEDAEVKHADAYTVNRMARAKMRVRRKEEEGLAAEHKALNLPEDVRLLPASDDDAAKAKLAFFAYEASSGSAAAQQDSLRGAILAQPIFPFVLSHRLLPREPSGGGVQGRGGGGLPRPRRHHTAPTGTDEVQANGAQPPQLGESSGHRGKNPWGDPVTVTSHERSDSPMPKRQRREDLHGSGSGGLLLQQASAGANVRGAGIQQQPGGRPPSGPDGALRQGSSATVSHDRSGPLQPAQPPLRQGSSLPSQKVPGRELALVATAADKQLAVPKVKQGGGSKAAPTAATAARKATIAAGQGAAQASVAAWMASRAVKPSQPATAIHPSAGGLNTSKVSGAGAPGAGSDLKGRAQQLAHHRRNLLSASKGRQPGKGVF